ncbi:MAG: AraC family transcriptional regulator [Bacteroidota bacterium]|nr:AraC family transcriptional regulator [Bacteroidota bacterium]
MKLSLNTYQTKQIIEKLAEKFNTDTTSNYLEEILNVPKKYGEGRILGFDFSDGVGLLLFDCSLKKDCVFLFDKDLQSPLLFNFMVEGSITHSYNNHNTQYSLIPLQSTITSNPKNSSEEFVLQGNESLIFASIIIDREKFGKKIESGEDQMSKTMRDIFLDIKTKNSFFYETDYSISSSENIQDILQNKYIELVRSIYLEGITLELLSRQIKVFKDNLETSTGKKNILSQQDVEKIIEAKEILLGNLQEAPTIEALSKQVGINQTKLKIGFKDIFEKPVKTWVRHKQLDKAKLLLLENKKSVKEVAETVGYTNQSHFSKQFKNQYGFLPKDYLRHIKSLRNK